MGSILDMLDRNTGTAPPARSLIMEKTVEAGIQRISGSTGSAYTEDPLAFLYECMYTRDEADPKQPVKQWPTGACMDCRVYTHSARATCHICGRTIEPFTYVEEIVKAWHRANPPILVVPKPRRFRMSWLFTGLHTWAAGVRKESAIYLQSRTEEESKLLIDRCEFILENIPVSKVKFPEWERRRKPPSIHFANGSSIIGKPEGAHALRSVTATRILLDEVGFWENPRASYEAIKPLVEKGCSLSIISSASPGFFKNLVDGDM